MCTDAHCKVDKGREVYVNHPFGKLDEYNETEDWRHYIEGVNHFFEANEITDPDKRRSIFLVCVGAKPINWCEAWLPQKIQRIKAMRI